MQRLLMTRRNMLFSLVGLLLTATLTIWGCGGGSSYDDPSTSSAVTTTTTKSGNALVTAEELKAWMDEGKVNAPFGGFDRVVILDITGNATDGTNLYNTTGHIPGAQLIAGTGPFMANRAEGPFDITGSLVLGGKAMDALIQQYGIDGNTTIVLTSGQASPVNVTRPYATFRYWGFPKNRIKVLQGGNTAWTAAGYTLTKVAPVIKSSTYGVALGGSTNVHTEMRASLTEMIAYVKSIVAGNPNKVVIVDTVRLNTNVTSTADLLESGNTPMEGAMKGSYRYYATQFTNPTGSLTFKDAATILADLAAAPGTDGTTLLGAANRDAAKTYISICRAGNFASVGYFALDGIAYYNSNVDVKWYDGSYGQWNLLVGKDKMGAVNTTTNAGGQLQVGSVWETTDLMDNLTWSVDLGKTVVNYGYRLYAVEPSFATGNQLEDEDRAYRSVTTTSGGSASGGGGGC